MDNAEAGWSPQLCLVYTLHLVIWHFPSLNPPPAVNYINPSNMEVMPSKTVSNLMMEGRITKTSRFFQFLIKICFIPVSVKNEKIIFKVFSVKMLIYIMCAVLWNIFVQRMMFIFFKEEDFNRFLSQVTFSISEAPSLNILFSKVRLKRSVFSLHGVPLQ